ncbi:Hypothetical_protein [Hexamita inflata]|uniref:Hypothetical_protein n=1 Tax=Hexamita inflata TaxID=28002 RepID=A0AA86TIC1_9EUKA|nr:Hypothetical protein HINF_LOCUS1608 [Hexamita inflata]
MLNLLFTSIRWFNLIKTPEVVLQNFIFQGTSQISINSYLCLFVLILHQTDQIQSVIRFTENQGPNVDTNPKRYKKFCYHSHASNLFKSSLSYFLQNSLLQYQLTYVLKCYSASHVLVSFLLPEAKYQNYLNYILAIEEEVDKNIRFWIFVFLIEVALSIIVANSFGVYNSFENYTYVQYIRYLQLQFSTVVYLYIRILNLMYNQNYLPLDLLNDLRIIHILKYTHFVYSLTQ